MNYEMITDDEEDLKPAMSTTFVVKIMFCENASIQGYVQWIEQEKTMPYRSLMELVHLVETAVRKDKKGLIEFRSWDN